jgi:hypothetical protein
LCATWYTYLYHWFSAAAISRRNFLVRIDGLRETFGEAFDGEPKRSPRCLREMDKLESRLKQRCQAGIRKLMAVIDARCNRLSRLSKEMEVELVPLRGTENLYHSDG